MTIDRKLEHFKARCKEQGIKLTPQRLIIYEKLINTTEHPTVDMLYAQVKETFPTISLDTVHRTLMTFCDIGVASMVEGTGSPKRFEGNLKEHHHVRCVKCGKIVDFYHEEYDHMSIPADVQEEFQILGKTVHVEGICRTCSQKAEHET
jgi:Fur family peroxide stress response transcriptional regulator